MGAAQSPIVGLTGPDPYTVITNAAGIVRLSPELAKSGLPVRLRGQVTSYDHLRVLFVQDKTAGVFVYYTGDRLPLRPGQYVQVTGVAQPGRFSPIITAPVIELLDSGPTINPQSVSLAQIQYGGLDAQWVEFSGVVRKQGIIESRLWLEVADPPQRVEVWVADYQASDQLPLCGGRVRIRGVVGSRVNPAGEILGFQVLPIPPLPSRSCSRHLWIGLQPRCGQSKICRLMMREAVISAACAFGAASPFASRARPSSYRMILAVWRCCHNRPSPS